MKKYFLLLFLELYLSLNANCQSVSFDSTWKEISLIKDDTSRADKIISLVRVVRHKDLVLAQRLTDSLKVLLKNLNYKKGDLYYYLCEGQIKYGKEDFVSSIMLADTVSYLMKQYNFNDPRLEARVQNLLGLNYVLIKDYDRALAAYQNALLLYTAIGDENMAATNVGNIGSVYRVTGKYEMAKQYMQFNIESDIKFDNKNSLGNDYESMADIMNNLNQPDSALYYCYEGMKLLNYADYKTHSMLLKDFGDAYFHKKDFKKSMQYYQDALGVANMKRNKLITSDIYFRLSKVYEVTGQPQLALNAYKEYNVWKDSTDVVDKRNQVALNDIFRKNKIKESEAQAEKNKYESELKQQKLIRNGTIAGLVVVLFFARIFFTQRNKIRKGKILSDELLLNILPSEVAEELKAKGSADAKQFDDVTVMFTDFKNFTQIAEKLSPSELVAEIHTCFKAFDHLMGEFNIEKIKTIGDAYMCAGGLSVANKTNAIDVVITAIEIQKFIQNHSQQRKKENKEPFEIRIGIHTGPVVAGIVGVKKFAYDIWGDTVNIASRMESSGEAGKVNISASTYELVKDKFNCIHRGKIQAKNKGEIDMYFVEGQILDKHIR